MSQAELLHHRREFGVGHGVERDGGGERHVRARRRQQRGERSGRVQRTQLARGQIHRRGQALRRSDREALRQRRGVQHRVVRDPAHVAIVVLAHGRTEQRLRAVHAQQHRPILLPGVEHVPNERPRARQIGAELRAQIPAELRLLLGAAAHELHQPIERAAAHDQRGLRALRDQLEQRLVARRRRCSDGGGLRCGLRRRKRAAAASDQTRGDVSELEAFHRIMVTGAIVAPLLRPEGDRLRA